MGCPLWYWNAYLGPSSAPCNLMEVKCPLYTLSSHLLVRMTALCYTLETRPSRTPPTMHTGKHRGSPPEALWWSLSLPVAVLSSTACELGFYKSAPGDQLCARCPPHSHSATPAAQTCRCDLSYYRAALDPPSAACTREYCLAVLLVGPRVRELGVCEIRVGWCVGEGAGSHCSIKLDLPKSCFGALPSLQGHPRTSFYPSLGLSLPKGYPARAPAFLEQGGFGHQSWQ